MDLSQFLGFLGEAHRLGNSALECLQHLAQIAPLLITQFEMVSGWFTTQATAQFLSHLEITRNYGNTPPEFRPQILYLLNELAQNQINLDAVIYQLDQLNDGEFPQIEEIFEEGDEPKQEEEEDSGGRVENNEFGESKESDESKPVESKPVESKESVQSKVEESNIEEPEHLRRLYLAGIRNRVALKAHFGQFGDIVEYIEELNPKNSKRSGFGYITYNKASMAEAALRASPLRGKDRVVRAERADPAKLAASKKRIYVTGHLKGIGERDLSEYFAKYGTVVEVKILVKKGTYAVVQFDSCEPVDMVARKKKHRIKAHRLVAKKTLYIEQKQVHSVEHEPRDGARDVTVGQAGYSRAGDGEYSRDGDGQNSGQQSQGQQQSKGQEHQQVGQCSDYGNSGYGNSSTGGGPIRRPNNRQHSTSGPY